MTKHRKDSDVPKTKSKRGRGRPAKIRASEVYGRAENYRDILNQVWDRLWPLLSNAPSEEEVTKAFQDGAHPYDQTFVPGLSALTLRRHQDPSPSRHQPLNHHCTILRRKIDGRCL